MNEQVESLQTVQPEAPEAQTVQPQFLKNDEDNLVAFTAPSTESQDKVRSGNRKKLIDYTVSRNPKYETGSCVEHLQRALESFQVKDIPENVLIPESEIYPRSPARLSMPSFRSIDSGSFTFQERPNSTEEERIDFMFKIKPTEKRSGRKSRLEALRREQRPSARMRLQLRLFASEGDNRSDPFVAERSNSTPNSI
jgi:hypothetical protein